MKSIEALSNLKVSVLLADDNADNLFTFKTLLKKIECETAIVSSGIDVLQKLDKQNFDLVILDAQMPHLDGFATLQKIKNHPSHSCIPVILVSDNDIDNRSSHLGFELGAFDVIIRPFSDQLFRSKVSGILSLLKKQKQHILELEDQFKIQNSMLIQKIESFPIQLSQIVDQAQKRHSNSNDTSFFMNEDLSVEPKQELPATPLLASQNIESELTLTSQLTDPQSIAQDVAQLLSIKAQAKSLKLETTCDTSTAGLIKTDTARLRQILISVIENAIDFTSQGFVKVHIFPIIAEGKEYTAFEVSDSGVGILADMQNSIFQYNTLKQSRHLAQVLGGDLHLVSSITGQGSTFLITIANRIDGAPQSTTLSQKIPKQSHRPLIPEL